MIWLVPSTVALLIKCGLFFSRDIRKKYGLFSLLCVFFVLNLLEFMSFFRFDYDLLLLKIYYFVAIFTFFYLLFVCAAVSQYERFIYKKMALVLVSILATVTLLTEHIVAGFSPLPNGSVTRIAGPYYFIFQCYGIFILVLSVFLLISRLLSHADYYLKAKCVVAALSFIPTIVVILLIIGLMHLGYQVNMVGFLSLSSCFMLLIFIPLSNEKKLFNTMKFVPFSRERNYHLKMQSLVKQLKRPITGESVHMKELLKSIEALVIENTHNYFATQKEVAKALTISASNISRKVDKQTHR